QWKRGTTAYPRLVAMGVQVAAALHTSQHLRRWWFAANSPGMSQAMDLAYFDRLGLLQLA
ncbi:MAG TPA: hypothetical protein VGM90_34870, partial [Kofleriaceae bacterium]